MNSKSILIIILIVLILATFVLMIILLNPNNDVGNKDIQPQPQIKKETNLEEPPPIEEQNIKNLENKIEQVDELEKSLEAETKQMEEELTEQGL